MELAELSKLLLSKFCKTESDFDKALEYTVIVVCIIQLYVHIEFGVNKETEFSFIKFTDRIFNK